MLKSYQKSHFPHFLRKWSEHVRTTLLSNVEDLKPALFLSTFIFVAEKMRILIQQEASNLVYCVAIGGSTKPIDVHTDALLRSTICILFLPDFDQAGALAWVKWKRQFPKINRILTPRGKSAGEGVNLREWLEEEITNSNKT